MFAIPPVQIPISCWPVLALSSQHILISLYDPGLLDLKMFPGPFHGQVEMCADEQGTDDPPMAHLFVRTSTQQYDIFLVPVLVEIVQCSYCDHVPSKLMDEFGDVSFLKKLR